MDFDKFWADYKSYRQSIQDYGWSQELIWRIGNLSGEDRKIVLSRIFSFIKDKADDWYVALDAIEHFGHKDMLDDLLKILENQNNLNIIDDYYALILKVITLRKPQNEFIEQYIKCGKMESKWKYLVKNLPKELNHFFVEAFARYFIEHSELGFDFDTYLSYNHDKYNILKNHFKDDVKISSILKKVNLK